MADAAIIATREREPGALAESTPCVGAPAPSELCDPASLCRDFLLHKTGSVPSLTYNASGQISEVTDSQTQKSWDGARKGLDSGLVYSAAQGALGKATFVAALLEGNEHTAGAYYVPVPGLSHVDQRLPAPAPGLQTAQGIVRAVLVPGPSTALPRCPSVLLIRPDLSEGSAPAPVSPAPTENIPHKDVQCPRGHGTRSQLPRAGLHLPRSWASIPVLRDLPPPDSSASRFTRDREELGMRHLLRAAHLGTPC
ncbi:unnamed protein product [Rangifer tarandus platyrhynchus]|uniref:Uncharacterized protein n=1 Tax=Rangifer tarandus platyrhynchus TaxID=3082113 RepID=A0AC59Z6F8_RANTA